MHFSLHFSILHTFWLTLIVLLCEGYKLWNILLCNLYTFRFFVIKYCQPMSYPQIYIYLRKIYVNPSNSLINEVYGRTNEHSFRDEYFSRKMFPPAQVCIQKQHRHHDIHWNSTEDWTLYTTLTRVHNTDKETAPQQSHSAICNMDLTT
jgi:hypothetical protein